MKLIEALEIRAKVLEAERLSTIVLIKNNKLGRHRYGDVNRVRYEIEQIKKLIEEEKEKEND